MRYVNLYVSSNIILFSKLIFEQLIIKFQVWFLCKKQVQGL